MEINSDTKIFDLLENYPEMEDYLIELAPPFKNLKNPVLRKTIGKMATLKQAADIAGIGVMHLVNTIRSKVNQTTYDPDKFSEGVPPAEIGDWTSTEAKLVLNGNQLLADGINPLAEMMKQSTTLNSGEFILFITDFKPIPLIEKFEAMGFQVVSADDSQKQIFKTYFKKL